MRRLAALLLLLLAPFTFAGVARAASAAPMGPEGIPLEIGKVLAPASTAAQGKTVDGIACDAHEQVAYHVHTHLAIYVDGSLRPLPPGVGLVVPVGEQTAYGPFYGATTCYYWLHVHTQDGVIHIESPGARTYTLGEFFDIWRQSLSPDGVGAARGTVTTYVNGRSYRGNPRSVTLGSHVDIQLDVGKPAVSFKNVNWSTSQL
ncbi:MAG TPA: hypothetical protein VNF07_11400 [Acidimicrobiales bacterium]|nr:hypothetical protein [Acidimicrobiales bacterium]